MSDPKRVSRREFFRLSGAAAGAALLASCAPAPAAPAEGGAAPAGEAAAPASDKAVTITLWNADWGKDFNDPMLKLNDAFIKDVMPNAKIETTFMPTLSQKLAAAIAGGNPPDCAIIDEGYGIPKMALTGGLISLKDYFDKDGVKQEDFIPFTWETILYKGVPYGIPGGAGTVVLMYDKAVFKEAGIDPESVPDTPTWDQFVEWNARLLKKDSNGKITRIGVNPDAWSLVNHFQGILGWQWYNADRTQLTINSEPSIKAVETWVSLLPEGVPYDDISNMLAGAPTSTYGTLGAGVQAIIWDGYWAFLALDKYWPDMDYGMIKLPTPNGTKEEWKLYSGWVWDPCIPKGAKHPDEAWAFMKYGYWEHGAMLADTLNWTSAVKQFPEFEKRTLAIMGEDNRERPFLHHFSEVQYAGSVFQPFTPIYQKLNDTTNQAIDTVIRGQKSAKEALDEVVATMQPELDKANAAG